MDEVEYAQERCDNCGKRDISISGPRGAFCSRECREEVRAADQAEHDRVRRNLGLTVTATESRSESGQ